MFTYLILNVVFIVGACLLLKIRPLRPSKPWLIMFVSLILLTLVFDSLMIALGFFSYSPEKILGIRVGNAPIEDFFYAVLAALIIPTLWHTLEKR